MTTDPVKLLQDLIKCPSVTPREGGALELMEKLLTAHGFTCHRLKFSEEGTPDVENLYARFGTESPHICFAGHTDVVPVGDLAAWSCDPFGGIIRNGQVWGRGAADMKSGIAAFAAAALDFIAQENPKGSISLLLTGDEEGPAINGTKKVLDWMQERGEKMDFCVVGEPTSKDVLGDMIKIGRRGSLTGHIMVKGLQGHAAYPHLADNPVPKMLKLLSALDALNLDQGTTHFQPSNLEIVTVDVGNTADNVIPARCHATFNVRFNDVWTGATLEKHLLDTLDACAIPHEVSFRLSGDSFYTPPGQFSDMVAAAIEKETGKKPELSTSGGTSDARFIKNHCPVVECGSVGKTNHQVDEHVAAEDVHALTRVYRGVLERFFLSSLSHE